MILKIHLMTTRRIPELPANVGSCQPVTDSEVQSIISSLIDPSAFVIRYQAVCVTPGITRGTVSQYSLLVQYRCNVCSNQYYTSQFNFICHRSTNSFLNPSITAIRGGAITFYDSPEYNPLPIRNNCGECSNYFFRFNPQHCAGILV